MALALTGVYPLSEECEGGGPSLASLGSLLFLAWKGTGNNIINISVSDDGGLSFRRKYESTNESTFSAPCIISTNGTLFIAWTGTDSSGSLNVASVILGTDDNNEVIVAGFADQAILSEFSDAGPALAAYDGLLYLAWKGVRNTNITLASSSDGFATWNSNVLSDNYADRALSMAVYNNNLYLAWKGTFPTTYLNFAIINQDLTISDQVTLDTINPQETFDGPALASNNPTGLGTLFTAFQDLSQPWLSITSCQDPSKWLAPNYTGYQTANSPALTWFDGGLIIAWPDNSSQQIQVGRIAGKSTSG